MRSPLFLLPCLLTLHSPDGSVLKVESNSIYAIRPSSAQLHEHLAKGTNTVLYVNGKVFGVVEPLEKLDDLIEQCEPGSPQ